MLVKPSAHQIHTNNMHSSLCTVSFCLRTGLRGYVHLGVVSLVLLHHTLPRVEYNATDPFDGLLGARGKGGPSVLIRCNHCGRAMGITAYGWDKITAKLASIDCRSGATLLVPATSLSAAAAVEACKPSAPCIVLVKAECINLHNYLMHVFMHEILIRRKMREVLLCLM